VFAEHAGVIVQEARPAGLGRIVNDLAGTLQKVR
jgi:hypothetical protein